MAENKTRKNDADVTVFLDSVDNDRRREDGYAIMKLMREVTGEEPTMWGDSIIGYGEYHYKYDSGREGDFLLVGFAPRKQNISLYGLGGFAGYDTLLGKLGKHKIGGSCLYINKLSDVNEVVLRELVADSYRHRQHTTAQT